MTQAGIRFAWCLARGGAREAVLPVEVGVYPPGSTNTRLLLGRWQTSDGPLDSSATPASGPGPKSELRPHLAPRSCSSAAWNRSVPVPRLAERGRSNSLPLAHEQLVILSPSVISSFLTFCREEIHLFGSLTGKEAGRTQPGPGLSWGVAGPATSPGPILGRWQKGEKQIDSSGPSTPPLPAQEQFAFIRKATQSLQRAGLPAARTAGKFFLNYFFIA